MTVRWYDRAGEPMPEGDYGLVEKRLTDPEYKIIAKTEVGEAEVSTVWLGLDHRFMGDGPPLIFETMIFGGVHDQQEQWQYATEAEARKSHDEIVAALRAGRDPSDALSEEQAP